MGPGKRYELSPKWEAFGPLTCECSKRQTNYISIRSFQSNKILFKLQLL